MPGGQEPGQHLRRDRFGLLAQPGQAAAAQQAQHLRVAPFGPARTWPPARTPPAPGGQELALDHPPVGREPPQRHRHHRGAQPVPPGHRGRGERAVRPRVPGHQVAQRVGDRLGERLGHAQRQRHPERVPQPARVLDRGPHRLPGDPHLDDPPRRGQLGQPARANQHAPRGDLRRGQRPRRPQQVEDALQVPAAPALRQVLQVSLGLRRPPRDRAARAARPGRAARPAGPGPATAPARAARRAARRPRT